MGDKNTAFLVIKGNLEKLSELFFNKLREENKRDYEELPRLEYKLPLLDERTHVILMEHFLRYKEALRRGEFYRKNSEDRF